MTNNNLKTYYQDLINKHIFVFNCKECIYFKFSINKSICSNYNPDSNTCIILKYYR